MHDVQVQLIVICNKHNAINGNKSTVEFNSRRETHYTFDIDGMQVFLGLKKDSVGVFRWDNFFMMWNNVEQCEAM